jgi:hypothetical protein
MEKQLYFCGENHNRLPEEWWILMSEENRLELFKVMLLTGKPIEVLVNLAVSRYLPEVQNTILFRNDQSRVTTPTGKTIRPQPQEG